MNNTYSKLSRCVSKNNLPFLLRVVLALRLLGVRLSFQKTAQSQKVLPRSPERTPQGLCRACMASGEREKMGIDIQTAKAYNY